MSNSTTSSGPSSGGGAISIGSLRTPQSQREPVPATRKRDAEPLKTTARKAAKPKTQKDMDRAIEDSFPASDPPSHSSPTRAGTASKHPR